MLPFRQLDGNAIPGHISDGLVADVVCQLAGLRELSVISHGSTLGLREPQASLGEIGQRLGAQYLVRGGIRGMGGRVRVTVELTEAASGEVLWARSTDMDDPLSFELQDRVVARIVNRLAPRVHENELRRIRGKRPERLSAYEKILLARERTLLLRRDDFTMAKDLLDDVITEEPDYAEAYALAADWHLLRIGQTGRRTGPRISPRARGLPIRYCFLMATSTRAGDHRSPKVTHSSRLRERAGDVSPCTGRCARVRGCLAQEQLYVCLHRVTRRKPSAARTVRWSCRLAIGSHFCFIVRYVLLITPPGTTIRRQNGGCGYLGKKPCFVPRPAGPRPRSRRRAVLAKPVTSPRGLSRNGRNAAWKPLWRNTPTETKSGGMPMVSICWRPDFRGSPVLSRSPFLNGNGKSPGVR